MKRVHLTNENGTQSGMWFNISTAESFKNATEHNGKNWINKSTDDQWTGQTLYITKKKVFILCAWSLWQGSKDTYTIIPKDEAAAWLMENEYYEEANIIQMGILENFEL